MRLERWIYTVPLQLRALFRRRQLDRELEEELQDHIERQIDEHIAKGLTPEQARTVVLRAFGGIERRKEECRDMRRRNVAEDLWKDVRHAVAVLRRSPGFTAIAVLTLTLGIGANTAIFRALDELLLKNLPVEEPQRLVTFAGDESRTWKSQVSYPLYTQLRDRNDVLSGLIALNNTSLVLDADASVDRILGENVSGNYFAVLGCS